MGGMEVRQPFAARGQEERVLPRNLAPLLQIAPQRPLAGKTEADATLFASLAENRERVLAPVYVIELQAEN